MRWGLGRPLQDIDMAEDEIVYHYFLELWVDMWFYTFSVGLSKFVILGFYWRTFSLSVTRQPIRVLFVCSACWIIVRVSERSTTTFEDSTLIFQGYTHLDAMSADSEILAQGHPRQMSIATDNVALCRGHTSLHS
jgi:hypothetical protein